VDQVEAAPGEVDHRLDLQITQVLTVALYNFRNGKAFYLRMIALIRDESG
jgi:hypothetical protein